MRFKSRFKNRQQFNNTGSDLKLNNPFTRNDFLGGKSYYTLQR